MSAAPAPETTSDAHGPSEVQPIARASQGRGSDTPAPLPKNPASSKRSPAAPSKEPGGLRASNAPATPKKTAPGAAFLAPDAQLEAQGFAPGSANRSSPELVQAPADAGKAASRAVASPANSSTRSAPALVLKAGADFPKGPTLASLPPDAPSAQRFNAWLQDAGDDDNALDLLCAFIARGGSLLAFTDAGGFAYSTVRRWINEPTVPLRAANYARAREDRADVIADEIAAIADEAEVRDVVDPKTGAVIGLELDATAVQRNRLRVDARKWLAAKMKPRVYGDSLAIGGSDALPPVRQRFAVEFVAAARSAAARDAAEVVDEVFPALPPAGPDEGNDR